MAADGVRDFGRVFSRDPTETPGPIAPVSTP